MGELEQQVIELELEVIIIFFFLSSSYREMPGPFNTIINMSSGVVQLLKYG